MAAVISERMKRFNIYKFVLSIPGILLVYSLIFIIYFLLRNAPNGNDPIFLKLGSLTFRWYGIIITVGVILAAFTTQYLSERRGENPDRTWVLLPVVLVSGIIGARFWYVFNTWSKYKDHVFSFGDPSYAGVFEVWRGGIAIQGAVAGGVVGLLIYKWVVGLNFLRWADFVAPGLILAQACGRWGNFMNNEAYGSATSVPWGLRIPCEYRTTGGTPGTVDTSCAIYNPDQRFHPTFLYESLWDYAVFLTLLFAVTKPKTVQRWTKLRLRDGDIFFFYLILYSIGRFIVESLRTDPLYIIGDPVNGGIRSAQALSIIGIFIGAVALFYRHRSAFPDGEALSVRVRPEPTKRELRQQRMVVLTGPDSQLVEENVKDMSLEPKDSQADDALNADSELTAVSSAARRGEQDSDSIEEQVETHSPEALVAQQDTQEAHKEAEIANPTGVNGMEEADQLAAEATKDEGIPAPKAQG